MNPTDLIHLLKLNGWEVRKEVETHLEFYHKTKVIEGKIILPLTSEDLSPSTLDAILKKAGIKK